ncbi:mucin-binding protein [Limosilactobacillus caecicola]|uniref:mucin-binding protein n=1 Tax=Limosilactobacillus caecicola TaxID=2941332 RepID=UPI00203C86B2|nr:MBG domain-containing protein [Limosilactobacillus caecicola]
MRKNRQKLNRANEKQQNYRLYKAKKQWITACATLFLTLGASAVVATSVQADEVSTTSADDQRDVAVTSQDNSNSQTSPAVKTTSTASEITKMASVANDQAHQPDQSRSVKDDHALEASTTVEKTADVTISRESIEQTYNGQAATIPDGIAYSIKPADQTTLPEEVNNIDFNVDDYSFTNTNGEVIDPPTVVGTYHIILNDKGLTKLENAAPDVSFNYDPKTSYVIYQITRAQAVVELMSSGSKTYDGQPATMVINATDVKATGIVNGERVELNGLNLLDDLTWTAADNNSVSGLPTDVGTYKVTFNEHAVKTLENDNLNYTFSTTGQYIYTITPFAVTITTTGTAKVYPGTTTIPQGAYNLSYGDQTMPTGWVEPTVTEDDFAFTGDQPTADTVSGTYSVNFKGGQDALQELLGSNYTVTYTPASDNYVVQETEGTETIQYVDADDLSKVVGTQEVTGSVNAEVPFTAQLPENWKLADGEELPTQVQIKNGTIKIKVTHDTEEINPSDEKPSGVQEADWKQTYTRQITVTEPGQPSQTITQEAVYTRTVTVDKVTGAVVGHGGWQLARNGWTAFIVPTVAGYTAVISPANSNLGEVENPGANEEITITYTANQQTGKISYVGPDDLEVGSTTLTGQTGDVIKVSPVAPSGWKVVPGQQIPQTVTATADGIPTVIVHVEHNSITVDPSDPKTPADKLPDDVTPGKDYPGGDYYPAGVAKDDLTKTITRTIIEQLPSGAKTVTQSVTLTRVASVDLITGEVTYGAWTTDQWPALVPEAVAGYTADPANVPAADVTSTTDDQTVIVKYLKNNSGNSDHQQSGAPQPSTPTTSDQGSQTATPTQPQPSRGQGHQTQTPAHQLPQTGSQQNSGAALGLLGIILAGMLGLGKRKKEDD